MTITRSFPLFSLAFAALALTGFASAQLATTLQISRQQFVAGEPVIATVAITNHAGQTLTFAGDQRTPWLSFMVKDRKGEIVTPRRTNGFGKLVIRAGETLAREVNLSEHFQLSEPGTYSVAAVIRMPGDATEGSSTNRVLFNQSPGSRYWTQKVGIPGKPGRTREFRVLNFSGDKSSLLYVQIIDNSTGQNVRTFSLGEVLLLRKPLVTVDKNQQLHVLYLATPTLWVHCQIDTDGKLVDRNVHKRAPQGDPQLLTFGDGTVRVANSIPFDPKAAAEARAKIRKASDRPPGIE